MIKRDEREALALALRRLASGRSTTSEFDEHFPCASDDPGVEAISWIGWTLYSDYRTYLLRGRHALPPEAMEAVARCILFLHSDIEYEWPPVPKRGLGGTLLAVLSLGWLDKRGDRDRLSDAAGGDALLWPFLRRTDYDAACQNPRFLVQ